MKKTGFPDWTGPCLAAIVSVLFCVFLVSADEGASPAAEMSASLEEARVARAVAEQRCVELGAELKRAGGELETMRRRYAQLSVQSRLQAAEFEDLQLRVAGLLVEGREDPAAVALPQALESLDRMVKGNAELYAGVREFGRYLAAVLDVLQPSAVVRREISERYARLETAVDRLERLPSLVAGRGGTVDRVRRECRVLAVNDDLQVVILDAGTDGGVRLGMVWHVVAEDAPVAEFRVVAVRPTLCAAMPVKGGLRRVAAGMLARAGERPAPGN